MMSLPGTNFQLSKTKNRKLLKIRQKRLNSAIDNLSERVDIHCEKVARREVGALTARKPISKAPTIITPVNPGLKLFRFFKKFEKKFKNLF